MSEKNYDPRMHTTEHILNQTMVRRFGCPRSANSHIEKRKSKCDYILPTEPSAQTMADIENEVNSIISANLAITDENITQAEAREFLDLSKLPPNAPETIRVVRVGGYDACACIGPHVKNTSEIGIFKITSHSWTNGTLRVRFKLFNQ
ncbi:MAG TPA: hypothetical protein VFC87_02720 [Perlabentimonas sp.]|nr:hypothetical protein [Tenuifilaceae bacterium]HZJ73696.1 hypothetical protein [Perlabentimonas sp.]